MATCATCRAQESPSSVENPSPVAGSAPNSPFFKRLFSLEAIGATLPGAALQQIHNWPDEWGKHRAGFEKRVASLYGQFVIGVLIEDGVKAIHKEDTRYRRSGQGNFFRRTGHVIARTVTARNPSGGRTMAWSMPANAYGSWAIATMWSPREYRTAASIAEWGTAGMGTVAGTNFLKEFWPDLKSVFRGRK